MAIGLQTQHIVERRFIDATVFYDYINMQWYTRAPIQVVSYHNIIKAFSADVWATILIVLSIFSMLFFTIYQIYKGIDSKMVGETSYIYIYLNNNNDVINIRFSTVVYK